MTLGRERYEQFKLDGKIDWNESALGDALNDIIDAVEKTIDEEKTNMSNP